jgi:hypothetical protein
MSTDLHDKPLAPLVLAGAGALGLMLGLAYVVGRGGHIETPEELVERIRKQTRLRGPALNRADWTRMDRQSPLVW